MRRTLTLALIITLFFSFLTLIPVAFAVDVEITQDGFYDSSNRSTWFGMKNFHPSSTTAYSGGGNSFMTLNDGKSYKIKYVVFHMYKIGSPLGTAYVKIYTHSGTFGTSSVPDTLVATSDGFDVSTFTGSGTDYEFNFSGTEQVTLDQNTAYVAVWENPASGDIDNQDYIQIGIDTTGEHEGNMVTYRQSAWSYQSAYDMASFGVYGEEVEVEGEYTYPLVETGSATASLAMFAEKGFNFPDVLEGLSSLVFGKEAGFFGSEAGVLDWGLGVGMERLFLPSGTSVVSSLMVFGKEFVGEFSAEIAEVAEAGGFLFVGIERGFSFVGILVGEGASFWGKETIEFIAEFTEVAEASGILNVFLERAFLFQEIGVLSGVLGWGMEVTFMEFVLLEVAQATATLSFVGGEIPLTLEIVLAVACLGVLIALLGVVIGLARRKKVD